MTPTTPPTWSTASIWFEGTRIHYSVPITGAPGTVVQAYIDGSTGGADRITLDDAGSGTIDLRPNFRQWLLDGTTVVTFAYIGADGAQGLSTSTTLSALADSPVEQPAEESTPAEPETPTEDTAGTESAPAADETAAAPADDTTAEPATETTEPAETTEATEPAEQTEPAASSEAAPVAEAADDAPAVAPEESDTASTEDASAEEDPADAE